MKAVGIKVSQHRTWLRRPLIVMSFPILLLVVLAWWSLMVPLAVFLTIGIHTLLGVVDGCAHVCRLFRELRASIASMAQSARRVW